MKASFTTNLLLATALFFVCTVPTFALDATPSGDTITENLKQRLIETINQVEAGTDTQSLGYVGKVRDIVQDTIVIEDKTGKKNVIINDTSDILRAPGNTEIKIENVRIDDGIIAIGTPMENNDEIQGKRIIVSDELFSPPSKTSGVATITKIGKSSLVLSVAGSGNTITVDTTNKTVTKTTAGSLELTDLEIGDVIVYSALVDDEDTTDLTATTLMRISSTATPEPEEN